MHMTFEETAAIRRVAVEAAEQAAYVAMRRHTAFAKGQRVTFAFGAGEWLFGTVWELTMRGDEVCAWLMIAGGQFHCEPVSGLRRVCGVCPDCRTLNQRPGCMS